MQKLAQREQPSNSKLIGRGYKYICITFKISLKFKNMRKKNGFHANLIIEKSIILKRGKEYKTWLYIGG